MEFIYRFAVGGVVVTAFAMIADILKPKSFAGLFGSAPSVALATLSLTILKNGRSYAALEARSMVAGAIAFFVYGCLCVHLMGKNRVHAARAAFSGIAVWLFCALGAWLLVLK